MEAKKTKKPVAAKEEAKKEPVKRAPGKKAVKKVDPTKAFCLRLKKVRLDRGLTIKELAEKAHVSDSTIQSYEKGEYAPKLTTIIKVVDALGYKIVLDMK